MSIVEFEGLPTWSIYSSETGERATCPWVGVVEGTAVGTLLTPPLLPTGILYSPHFRSHQKTKIAARRTSTISRKNRGL